MGRVGEQLDGTLPEVPDLVGIGFCLQRIGNRFEVHIFFQRMRLEQIVGELRSVSLLAKSEHQVNPLIKIGANVVAFQRVPVFHNEVLGAASP